MKKILFLFTFLLLLVSCKDDNNSPQPELYNTDKTVFVYMAADNNLANYATQNIESLKEGYAANNIEGNLVVYVDQGSPKLILLQKDVNGVITEKVIKTYANQNSVSSTVMSSVINDMVQAFPSKKYGLILWSHGYGWVPSVKKAMSPTTRWFGVDGGYFMDLPDLINALKTGPHFDYILFDACFMGGVEAAYALRNCTDYLITSPAEVMGDGFPYSKIFPYLFRNTESDYIKIASTFYEHYNGLSGANRSASIGCLKTAALEGLAAETSKLVNAHIAELNAMTSTASIQYFECYNPHLFYDFGHYIDSFTSLGERASFIEQLQKVVVYKACTPTITSVRNSGYYEQIAINNYSGLNCYIPQATTVGYNPAYKVSEWSVAAGFNKTNW